MGRSTLIFEYKVPDLYEEVIKRTSKLGAFRSSDNSPHLAERLSMDGEDYLFYDMLDEARNEVYGWLAPFGRDMLNANMLVLSNKIISRTVERDFGAYAHSDGERINFGTPTLLPIATDGVELSDENITVEPANGITIACKRSMRINYEVRCVMHTHVEGFDLSDVIDDGETNILRGAVTCPANDSVTLFGDESLIFPAPELEDDEVLDRAELFVTINIKPAIGVSTLSLKNGDYVEHVDCDGSNNLLGLYLMTADKDETEWLTAAIKLPYDPRDLLRYAVYGPEGTDANLVAAAKRHIQEALVNFVIYRWFEYTLPDEANRYHKIFEEAIRNAVREIDCNPMDIRKPVKFP